MRDQRRGLSECEWKPTKFGVVCLRCGHARTTPARRRCDSSPGGKEAARINLTAEIGREREQRKDWTHYTPRSAGDLDVRIRVCLDCDQHNGRICTVEGEKCEHRRRWLKRLACVGFRECERWGD